LIQIIRTDSENQVFTELVKLLDADLTEKDGDNHLFYDQFNKIEQIKYAVLAYDNEKLVGCGALKEYERGIMEIKRMYVSSENRGNGIATKILLELESWAFELYCKKCILETGKRQPEAIALYEKNGYRLIPNHGQYTAIENSICYEKQLDQRN